jgi:hypothetical protein
LLSRLVLLVKANWPVAAVALAAWISIIVCLDPAGSYPALPEGPGLTVDEIFNVEQGVYLLEMSRSLGWLNLMPGTSQEAFRRENGYYNPDHPPLGRYWLGFFHHVAYWVAPPFQPDGPAVTACARTGSATAFALTVFLIGSFATAGFSRFAGICAAISLVLMPRVYGHAHLAALETATNLTCTLAVVGLGYFWAGAAVPDWRRSCFVGVLLGLAMLTKIQAVLIPVPVILWAAWKWKQNAVVPLLIWGLSALVIFYCGWPFLWFDPLHNIAEYLGRTTNRATINVWYFGQKYPDKLVPWHYSPVMFALTVPVILHLVGIAGAAWPFRALKPAATEPRVTDAAVAIPNDRDRNVLLLGCTFFPVVMFALPGIAVYDGERLFLTSFPLWALFIGRGASLVKDFLERQFRSSTAAATAVSLLLAVNALPLFLWAPCHLCYYNEVVWALGGAEKLGLEIDYWGEGVTRGLLQRVAQVAPEGESVAIVPTLHQFQADEYRRQSPILRSRGIRTVEFRSESRQQEFILIYRRFADLPPGLNPSNISGWTIIDRTQQAYFARRNE